MRGTAHLTRTWRSYWGGGEGETKKKTCGLEGKGLPGTHPSDPAFSVDIG